MSTLFSPLAWALAAASLVGATPSYCAEAPPAQDFSLALLQEVAAASDGNVCLSPWSAGAALSLVQPGAAGTTRRQMDAVLGDTTRWNKTLKEADLAMTAAERVYVDNSLTLKPAYRSSLPEGSVASADFRTEPEKARRAINDWAAASTDGLVRNLLAPGTIDADTRLAAVNAVLFRGTWARPFSPRVTREAPFRLSSGQTVPVPMMRQTNDFRYAHVGDCVAVALPYRKEGEKSRTFRTPESQVFFIALMPEKTTPIRPWLNKLTPERLAAVRTQLGEPSAEKQVNLALPRFSLEPPTANLSEALGRMGMQLAFGNKADFSGMTASGEPLYLSGVYQKCLVRVHEDGTEAAAATAVVVTKRAMPRIEAEFTADRPFVWMIATLDPGDPAFFAGVMERPGSAEQATGPR